MQRLIFVLILFNSCGAGWFDTRDNLGYGYRTDRVSIYSITSENAIDSVYIFPDLIKIHPYKDYLFVKQKPDKHSAMDYMMKYDFNNKSYFDSIRNLRMVDYDDSKSLYPIADSILKMDLNYTFLFEHKFIYYIINKRTRKISRTHKISELHSFARENNLIFTGFSEESDFYQFHEP